VRTYLGKTHLTDDFDNRLADNILRLATEFRTLPRIAKPFDPLMLLKELQRAKSQGVVII
jgi:hypothetical protein